VPKAKLKAAIKTLPPVRLDRAAEQADVGKQ
jgi:hypothetical protein